MAIVTRYFSTTGAGAADGTSWADRAALFQSVITVDSGTWSGTFVIGEQVTQTGTGATANVVLVGGSGTSFTVSNVAGSPNSSGVWTGAGSGATVTPTTTPAATTWTSIITGFAFNGSDSLECRIGPGSYTCGQALASGLFSNAPTAMNNLTLIGADSSGVELEPPDPGWVSCMPEFSTATFPVIGTTTNIDTLNLAFLNARMLRLEATARNGSITGTSYSGFLNWMYILNSTSNTGAFCVGGATGARMANSICKCSGTAYSVCLSNQSSFFYNVAAIGNISATTGARNGFTSTVGSAQNCFALNHIGNGFQNNSTTVSHFSVFTRCSAVNCDNGFARISSSSSATGVSAFINCLAVNCTGYGFLAIGNNRALAIHGRTRDNTFGNATDNFSLDSIYTAGGTDADEFVDAANGDYRIKNSSAYWGLGIGAGDEPASGGGVPLIGAGGLVY